jgi:hypothetical protein
MHSHSGWVGVSALRRGCKTDRSDEPVLESSFSVESELREAELQEEGRHRRVDLGTLKKRISHDRGISLESLTESGRIPAVSRAHALLSYVWVPSLGRSGRVLSRKVGGSPSKAPHPYICNSSSFFAIKNPRLTSSTEPSKFLSSCSMLSTKS